MENFLSTIMSQYANSPTLMALIENWNSYIDPTSNFDAFYNFVWNLDTAEGIGLDIWGRIVVIPRTISVQQPLEFFGFKDGASDYAPFDQEPFYSGYDPKTSSINYTLSDDAYRTLILIKAAANIAATTSPVLNQLLTSLFTGRGRAYVLDKGFMKMQIIFEFTLLPFERAIIQAGIIPHTSGVQVTCLQATGLFGFNEAGDAQPFNQGVFLSPLDFFTVMPVDASTFTST